MRKTHEETLLIYEPGSLSMHHHSLSLCIHTHSHTAEVGGGFVIIIDFCLRQKDSGQKHSQLKPRKHNTGDADGGIKGVSPSDARTLIITTVSSKNL